MDLAIALSAEGMKNGDGGPFGAIVVQGDRVVGRGWNQVLKTNDPTAHAEVVAIRDACNHLHTYQLHHCEVYTSCEPCPMCLGAIYWARPARVFYANTKADAAAIGFDDQFIYDEIDKPLTERQLPMQQFLRDEALVSFEAWAAKEGKAAY